MMIRITQTILIVSHDNPMLNQKANLGPKIPIKVKARSFINMAQSSSKVSFDQLSDRLKALTTQEDEAQNIDDIMKFTYEELKEEKISFGTAHRGRRFEEMLQETRYMTWFSQTYKNSQKSSHVKFLRFLQLHVENLEKKNLKMNKPKSLAKAMAKEKALHPTKEEIEAPSVSEDEDFETWEAIHQGDRPNLEVLQLQDRMQQMETLLHQVVEHLSQGANRSSPPPA